MIPEGINRVVCSTCGQTFVVDKEGESLTPAECPGCSHVITELMVPIDGSRTIAITESA